MADGDVFLELFPRADLVRTLRALWLSLLVSAAITTLIGVVAGRVVARRLLRPVEEVTAAAAAIAQGDLDARLDPGADPDLAELAASFNQTARSLQHRVQADARFAGDVSHELRTPLTTMVNAMESLKNRRRVLPATALEPLDLLDHELERFRQLVIDLLEISRADSGDEEVREPVRVAELVRHAADAAAGRPVTSVAPAAEHLEVAADRRRLAQVVANLVTNAELHGGGCTRVCVEATGRDVLVTVDDAGPGVPTGQPATDLRALRPRTRAGGGRLRTGPGHRGASRRLAPGHHLRRRRPRRRGALRAAAPGLDRWGRAQEGSGD